MLAGDWERCHPVFRRFSVCPDRQIDERFIGTQAKPPTGMKYSSVGELLLGFSRSLVSVLGRVSSSEGLSKNGSRRSERWGWGGANIPG